MGLYFRKSKSFGPFRINFSKSGIGVSAGVKGARVSVGPRGTYLNAGRNGLYYRKKIGGKKRSKASNTSSSTASSPTNRSQSALSASADNNPSVSRAEIDYDFAMNPNGICNSLASAIKKAQLYGIIWWFVFIICTLLGVWKHYILTASALLLLFRLIFDGLFTVFIDFELDEKEQKEWRHFSSAIEIFGNCNRVWELKPGWLVTIPPSLIGASVRVKKKKHGRMLGRCINTPDEFVALESSSIKVYFLPQIIIINKGHNLAVCTYKETQIKCNQNRINYGAFGVPNDTSIVDHVYEHQTKDGLPDRRYKTNRQYPIGEAAVLKIENAWGMTILLAASNGGVTPVVDDAGKSYRPKIVFANNVEKPKKVTAEKAPEIQQQNTAAPEKPAKEPKITGKKKVETGNRLLSEIMNNTTEGK